MRKPFLPASLLSEFLQTLEGFGPLYGPKRLDNGVTAFGPIRTASELTLDYRRTQLPPKKYLFPFRETVLTHRFGQYQQTEQAPEPLVLFGVHPCDLKGLAYLDRVFLADRPDPCYLARRRSLTLIGLSCLPDEFCFCLETGVETAQAPCDLFLESAGGGFFLTARGDKGVALVAAAGALLTEAQAPEPAPCPEPVLRAQDPALRFSDHPLWEEYARTCVSCGACSVCCPTCYCFDVREYQGLDGSGTRVREWDNCLFKSHAEVAGGDFRPTRLDRLRYRFLHKYCGFSPLQGELSCVGCGRCRAVCPVGIDLVALTDLKAPPPPSEAAED